MRTLAGCVVVFFSFTKSICLESFRLENPVNNEMKMNGSTDPDSENNCHTGIAENNVGIMEITKGN